MEWVDGSRCKQINAALRKAHDAFNALYYESQSNLDLFLNSHRVSEALNLVRREVHKNNPPTQGDHFIE